MSYYCDEYEHNSRERDGAGWPKGLEDSDKQWIKLRSLQELERSRSFGIVGLPVYEIASRVFSKDHPDSVGMPEKLRDAVGQDWRYACVARALRDLDCPRLWCVSNRDYEKYEANTKFSGGVSFERDLPPITVLTPQQRLALGMCVNPEGTEAAKIRANVRLALVEGGYIEVRASRHNLPRYYATYKGSLMLQKIDKVTKEREARQSKKPVPAQV